MEEDVGQTVQNTRATARDGLTYNRRRGRGGMTGSRAEISQAASNVVRPPVQARVYAITHQGASVAPQVITGMVSLYEQRVCALIDPGATHSFIAYELVDNLNDDSFP